MSLIKNNMKQSNRIKKPRLLTKDIPQEVKIKIIEDYRYSKDNSMVSLAKKYEMTYWQIDAIINEHFKSLKNDNQ
jgi:Mor family transcriptional regulator